METLENNPTINEINTVDDIIDPPIPGTPEGKLGLLIQCEEAIKNDKIVEKVTPHHVTQDGMYLIAQWRRQKRAQAEKETHANERTQNDAKTEDEKKDIHTLG